MNTLGTLTSSIVVIQGRVLDDCFLNLQSSFPLKPVQLLWLKRNCYLTTADFAEF